MTSVCPPEHAHASTDKLTCYVSHRCRCSDCKELSREYSYWRKHRTEAGYPLVIPALGTQRRLQALMCLGWSLHQVALHLNDRRGNIRRILTEDNITRKFADRISRVYDRLSMHPPVGETRAQAGAISRTKIFARRHGWVPPLAWDDIDTDPTPATTEHVAYADSIDQVAIDRALAGDPVRLTPAERRICIRTLHTRHWSDVAIAAQIGCNEKTVNRIRGDELNLPAWTEAEQLTDLSNRLAA